MNCDHAFDLMTEPQGSDSPGLQAHLAVCPRCRQMYETLAPALDWLSQAARPARKEPLTAGETSRGSTRPWSLKSETLARQSAAQLAMRAAPPRVRVRHIVALCSRYTAMLLAGFALALLIFPGAQRPATGDKENRCTRRDAAERSGRAKAEIESLVAGCSTCHKSADAKESAIRLTPEAFSPDTDLLVAVNALGALFDPVGSGAGFQPQNHDVAKLDRVAVARKAEVT
ncbi:MAG: hypothetical protein ACT4QC_16600 [Planctomycetaceae bacterium]